MATLQKMMICGLRSFGPNEEDVQSVKFGTPLTLILGENGCGKTTLIEALKFASSGDVPPGSDKGQGFVNDPKLSSKATTKGQVRLRFGDGKGSKYVVVKSVQLTNRTAKPQFKRLETVLQKINEDGTSTDISSRCVDIDATICDVLGVSKAILNSVIFCHQEESAWPLDEPRKLKERFDEIFGATDYNKCAEGIRKTIKEKINSNKLLGSEVVLYKQSADIVDKKKSELLEKEDKLANYEENIKAKELTLVPINKRLQEICELETNLSKLHENCAKKETMQKSLQQQQRDILNNIVEEYEGSDEQLKSEISLFEGNRENCEQQRRTLESLKLKVEASKADHSKNIDRLQIKIGKLQAEKKLHESNVTERNNLLESIKRTIPDVAFSVDSEGDVVDAIRVVGDVVSTSKSDFITLEQTCEVEEDELQKEINSSNSKLLKTKHEIDSKNQQIGELKGKSREIDSQLHELDYSDEKLKSLDLKISRINTDLKTMQTSFDADAVARSINDDKTKIRKDEEELEVLESEYKILQQNSIKEAELETLNHDIVKRNAEIHKFVNKHFESFAEIFGDDLPQSGFYTKNVSTNKDMKSKTIQDLNKKVTSKQKESTTLEAKCRHQKEQLELYENELEANRKKILEVCKGKPYERVYEELHQSIEKLQKDKGLFSSAKLMYEKFIRDFQKQQPCCPVCKTDFANKRNVTNEIVKELEKNIQSLPDKLKKAEEELKSKQLEYNNVLQIKPASDRVQELNTTKIPKLKSEYEDTNIFHKRVNDELADLVEELKKPQSVFDACNLVLNDSVLIDQYHQEVNRSKKKVLEIESQIDKVPSNRSRQQTEIEIENLKTDLSTLRRNSEMSQKKLQQHKDRCQELGESKNKYVEEQLKLQKAMQGKAQLYDQLKEVKEKEESLKGEIQELQIQLKPLSEDVKKCEKAKESLKIKNRNTINEHRMKLNNYQKLLDDIKRLQSKVEAYVASDGDGTYKSALTEIGKFRDEVTSLDTQIKEFVKNINEVTKRIVSQETSFRSLKDNLILREKRKQEADLAGEVLQLKTEIGEHNYKSILAEKKKLNKEEDEIRGEINMCVGRNHELKGDIKKLKTDLNTPENKQAHKRYKNTFLKHACSVKMVQDLEYYLKVLEKGILDFHRDRMTQINKIIRQLWRSIYRGNDCDYIEIKTEDTKNTGTRRAYNYKVVQVKSNTELDMRGRCSAGQKVLACLVIRMALAETFSKNCGILALDEPTTNLDRANIMSLSDALARLVNSRQVEKNFQLLVITHDEEFTTSLTRVVSKAPYFWRVSRNGRGNSIIERQLNN